MAFHDGQEIELNFDPLLADTDNDGLSDGKEMELGTNALVADTDEDGVTDGKEVELGLNVLVADTDADGIIDGNELIIKTDPGNPDTDQDGISDGLETQFGTNPLIAESNKADTDQETASAVNSTENTLTDSDTTGEGELSVTNTAADESKPKLKLDNLKDLIRTLNE